MSTNTVAVDRRSKTGAASVALQFSPACASIIVLTTLVEGLTLRAQPVPPGTVDHIQNIIGDRIETLVVLGGDHGASGGVYAIKSLSEK